MHAIIRNRMNSRKHRVAVRLDKFNFPEDLSRPMLRGGAIKYELSDRSVGTSYGGIGLMHQLVRELQLAEAIDARLHLFKIHLPYHESDHVLNLAYNALCDGRCLEDLELRRQDEAYLNLLGALRIPDPTTAGDFCRRFKPHDLKALQAAFDVTRRKVWARQPAEFFAEARIDADGKTVATDAECMQGIDLSYHGVWGYHPLVISLANTKEVLRLVNRPGNRPSHEGAAPLLDECITLCREAGFRKIVLRGDTDFSQTAHLDRWHEQADAAAEPAELRVPHVREPPDAHSVPGVDNWSSTRRAHHRVERLATRVLPTGRRPHTAPAYCLSAALLSTGRAGVERPTPRRASRDDEVRLASSRPPSRQTRKGKLSDARPQPDATHRNHAAR